MEILSQLYPDFIPQTTSLLRYLGALPLFMSIATTEGNYILGLLSVSLSGTHPHRRVISASIHVLGNSVSADVTFAEGKLNFTKPSLHGESYVMEDKDFFLLELSSLSRSPPKHKNSQSTESSPNIKSYVLSPVSPVMSPI